MGKIIIGSARHDENGKVRGGKEGDQTTHEVEMQDFYVHSKGWYVLRAKNSDTASKLAKGMKIACDNENIGYNQDEREQIYTVGTKTETKCNCDCSSLVRQIVVESGIKVGDFYTGDEAEKLMATGQFTKFAYANNTILKTGDILVTKEKGHTVIVVSVEEPAPSKKPVISKGYKDSEKGGTFCADMQRMLVKIGVVLPYNVDNFVDGSCGGKTVTAITKAQDKLKSCLIYKSTVDGKCGPATWAALEAICFPKHTTLKRGMKTDEVKIMQTKLNKLGHTLDIDGSFGPATEAAVKKFQKLYNLSVDGHCGPMTWAALDANT